MLIDRILARDPRAIARAISLVENEAPEAAAIVAGLYAHTGRAYLIGVTGPPGAGKSTLVDRLIAEIRKRQLTVGVLAIDPTSPFSGGAILGDRVRMQAHASDAGVFIRSMATRGHLGGLAKTTSEAALVLDAAGHDLLIVETVGVGQDEVDIVRTADAALVTLVPGAGDEVQTLKAGIMEIADIFVVNKSDRDGADRAAASIEAMLSLDDWPPGRWRPPVVRTEATTGRGVPELWDAIERFRSYTGPALEARRRRRVEWRLREMLGQAFIEHVDRAVLAPGEFEQLLARIGDRQTDPYTAVRSLLTRALSATAAQPNARSGLTIGLDHVGIAVRDPAETLAFFRDILELPSDEPIEPASQGVRVRFLDSGDVKLELVESASPSSAIAKFLERRGPGLHHVALRVRDLSAALAVLKARGVRLIDETPRPGAHGSRIAFVHPASAGGVLVELVERRAEDWLEA